MRLAADEQLAVETVAAAVGTGLTVFDTAHAYAPDGGRWVPDGRAKALAADCEASLEALDGLPIDLYLIHAPDPRTPWRTSVRALARLAEQGLVKRVGLANVTRTQLDEALHLAPVAAVQVALSPFDDRSLRGGVVSRCTELGLAVIAHSPLGGPNRASRLARRDDVTRIATRHGATAQEATLAWLLGLSPRLIAIPGARRPETARSAARAAALALTDDDRAALTAAFGRGDPPPVGAVASARATARAHGEIVMVMGIPGAGKTRLAADYLERGYVRLNRDERGGSLRALATELDQQLATGIREAILDNTYLTRASRSYVIEAAARHGLPVRCVWLDTPLAQAQVNLIKRLLERFGLLPGPEQIREAARREPWLMLPTSQMRALRELEPPSRDEGFVTIERAPFRRVPVEGGRPGVFVGAGAVGRPDLDRALADADPAAPHLLFDWVPNGDLGSLHAARARIADAITGPVDAALCPHPGGPPSCWCRPPLPGLPLAFARAQDVDPARSTLIGCSRAHLALATTLGARYIAL
jgi:diketogulonate reductase-like aldo/keto reductase/adenylate kinase family enzyme